MIFNKKNDNLVSISLDNDEGIRISKSNGITLTEYFVDGYNVLAEKTGNNVIYYTYDIDGLIMSMNYQDNEYFYIKNLQGDITEIVDTTGNSVAKYRYDAWGNIIYQYDDGSNISNINPYRYRGYRYDSDTGLYYLNARYYDSSIARFISADSVNYLDPSSEAGLNLYAYAGNNPVMYIDPSGNFAITNFLIMFAVSALATWAAGELFGHQLVGGIGSTANGVGAISTGISLMAFGPWGIAAGIMMIGIGAATAGFGINQVVDHFTGTNYIQFWGMSESHYNGWNIGLNITAGVGQIAGNIGMRYAANAKLNAVMKNPEVIQNYSKFQFKTYANYSNEWKLLAARNGKGMRALSTINNGNSIRYGYGINNAEHFYGSYYWIVANGAGKYRYPFI